MAGSNTSTTTQNSQPWAAAQPFLKDIMSQAQGLYQKGSSYAPFNTVAPFSPYQQEAQTLTADRALNGSPVINQADTTLQGLMHPQGNPYLDATYNQAAKGVSNSINSEFGMAGRGGSGANQNVLGQNLDNLATNIYGGAYAGDQQRALGASALAPTLANQDYTDLQNLMTVGNQQQGQAQNQIGDLLNRYNYSQQQPWNLLNQYSGAVNGMGGLGGSSSGTMTQPSNLWGNLAGAGATILGQSGAFGSGGWLSNMFG